MDAIFRHKIKVCPFGTANTIEQTKIEFLTLYNECLNKTLDKKLIIVRTCIRIQLDIGTKVDT